MIARHYLSVSAICPVDSAPDFYEATIETARVIPVEDILAIRAALADEKLFQEELTVQLARRIGAQVTTVGWHSGVRTEVVA